jgi:hypothetical protein
MSMEWMKTKVMVLALKKLPNNQQHIMIEDQELEFVDNFIYLGTCITANNDKMTEIQRRIKIANKTFFSILSIPKCNDVHLRTKIHIYKTVIRPTLLYGSKTWNLSQTAANIINSFERKILQRIFGPVNEQGLLRIRRNDELKELCRQLEISEVIRFK